MEVVEIEIPRSHALRGNERSTAWNEKKTRNEKSSKWSEGVYDGNDDGVGEGKT